MELCLRRQGEVEAVLELRVTENEEEKSSALPVQQERGRSAASSREQQLPEDLQEPQGRLGGTVRAFRAQLVLHSSPAVGPGLTPPPALPVCPANNFNQQFLSLCCLGP